MEALSALHGSNRMKLKRIETVRDGIHKFQAIFEEDGRERTVKFGAYGMSDYLHHKDKVRRQRYLDRHEKNENWSKPDTAGALSRFILWGPTTSLLQNIQLYRKRFRV